MNISAKYIIQVYRDGTYGLDDFSVDIDSGDFVTVLGESGCGKTTLLRVLAGLEKPTAGELYFNGVLSSDIPLKNRKTSMVFQEYVLYPKFTVWENVRTALERYDLDGAEENRRIVKVLKDFELLDVAGQLPKNLSGGQQQRVALAKAVVTRPDLLLFDEPLSNVAEKQRADYMKMLKALKVRLPDTTFVYVTHNVKEALSLGNKLLLMKDGHTLQYGDTEFVSENPIDVDALELLYESAFRDGAVENGKVLCDGREVARVDVPDCEVTVGEIPYSDKRFIFDKNGACLSGYPHALRVPAEFDGKKLTAVDFEYTVDGDFAYRYLGGRTTELIVPTTAIFDRPQPNCIEVKAEKNADGSFLLLGARIRLVGIKDFDGRLYIDKNKLSCGDGTVRTLAHYRVYESGCYGMIRNNVLILPCGKLSYAGANGRVYVTVKRGAAAHTAKNGLNYSPIAEDDFAAYRLAYCRLKGFDNYVSVKLDAEDRAFAKKTKLVIDADGISVRYI